MIELFTANTPNGKISIMLEEIGYEYRVTKIDVIKEQFSEKFKNGPFSKIPVIIDHKKNITVFESGAILIYLLSKRKIL